MTFIRRHLRSVLAVTIVVVVALAVGGWQLTQRSHDAAAARKGESVCAVYDAAKDVPSLAASPYTAIARDLCLKYRAGQ